MPDNCIFCRIIKGDIPAAKVFEDKDILAFLDISPANPGHTLVMPKKHVEKSTDLKEAEVKKLFSIVNKVTLAVHKAVSPAGYNIIVNNGKSAGQVVPHLHVHIIPRHDNDGIDLDWPQKKYADGQMTEVKDAIVKSL